MNEAKAIRNMSPVQNTGAENPTNASTVMKWLKALFGRRAAMTPNIVPITSARDNAVMTSNRVCGNASQINVATGIS